jgi:DNA-binding NtrC family response regulator
MLDSLGGYLTSQGYQVLGVRSFGKAIEQLRKQTFSLVIADDNMTDGTCVELLGIIKKNYPQTITVVITGYGTIESAVEAIKMGAYDYLPKPIIDDDLLLAVERGVKQHDLMDENVQLRSQIEHSYSLNNIVSHDYKMSKVFDLIEAVADTRTTILMTGPSGTGKSMLSRSVHYRSPRRDKPFVEVSCGALPDTLLESELFGHVKGSFTGAVNDKQGKFLAADGGTIFLDEISSASPALQVKLLRILQNRQFEPVGSNDTITVDTRVILASNRDLAEEVKAGRFREDLYYRINVVTVSLPPLCERAGDIPLLAEKFLVEFCKTHNRNKTGITDDAMDCLQRHAWPGNIRELENVIERAVLLSKGTVVDVESLPAMIAASSKEIMPDPFGAMSLKEAMDAPEKNIIRSVLAAHNWNRQDTAAALQINRTTLYKKMKRHGLELEAAELGL